MLLRLVDQIIDPISIGNLCIDAIAYLTD